MSGEILIGDCRAMLETEAADLRQEIVLLRSALAAADRENAVLAAQVHGKAPRMGTVDRTVVALDTSRVRWLEHAVTLLTKIAKEVASHDCYEYPADESKCTCDPCWAQRVLDEVRDWRFDGADPVVTERHRGAMHDRITNGHNPRETKIHSAWRAQVDDHRLGQILDDYRGLAMFHSVPLPTARDWYVATSVVQWLATNVGMGILESAGFEYKHFEEDRKLAEERTAQRSLVLP